MEAKAAFKKKLNFGFSDNYMLVRWESNTKIIIRARLGGWELEPGVGNPSGTSPSE